MLSLIPQSAPGRPLRVLCIGAHSDDLEIGCAGTLLRLLSERSDVEVTWVVLSASGQRAQEARRSARALLRRAATLNVELGEFHDGFLPAQYLQVKEFFERLKSGPAPDIIFTHRLEDRHQDHRLAAEMTWNTWRDHLVLEYEILKYEGDLATPNLYVPLGKAVMRRKTVLLAQHFGSQRGKHWFDDEAFTGLARLRGLECRAPDGYAEGFHVRKMVLAPGAGSAEGC